MLEVMLEEKEQNVRSLNWLEFLGKVAGKIDMHA
jgi:hypothetical protein